MQYFCSACSFTQHYMLPPRQCRLCARRGTMRAGKPRTPGFSIAGGMIFNNATGERKPFEPGRGPELWPSSEVEIVDEVDGVVEDCRFQYLLVQTLGACTPNDHSGDGAYSKWMLDCFPSHGSYCERSVRLEHKGGNSFDAVRLSSAFRDALYELLSGEWKDTCASVVVLNWHVRLTGRPNSWTGRGIDAELIGKLSRLCFDCNKELRVVYTIHEYSRGQKLELVSPYALVALNRQVRNDLIQDEIVKPERVFLSRVPNLESRGVTNIADLVRRHLPAPSDEEVAEGHDLGLAFVYRELNRYEAGSGEETPPALPHGIAIFGSITERHGLSTESVKLLNRDLDRVRASRDDFPIYIAGRTSDRELKGRLELLSRRDSRIFFLGEIPNLQFTQNCRYAISFDEFGYRDNASAMVNMVRAGTLLFCRRRVGDVWETDHQLSHRAATTIAACERQEGNYLQVLSLQQPLFVEMDAFVVALNLDRIFALLAGERL